MKSMMTVTLKFYSGIHKELNLESYDPAKGVTVTAKSGTRLKKILKDLGLPKISSFAYFCNGERIGLWTKLHDGEEVSCLKPSGGG